MAIVFLEVLCFFDGDVEANCEVVGEVVATNGKDCCVGDGAFEEDSDLGGAGTNVGDADAEFSLVSGEDGFGGGDALKDSVLDFQAGAIGASDDRLRDSTEQVER